MVYGWITAVSGVLVSEYPLFDLIFSTGLVVSCIGLLLKKGWAWNCIIFANVYMLFSGVLRAASNYYFGEYSENSAAFLIAIIVNLLFHGPIFYYLYRREIRKIYPKSPISLFAIAFFLIFYGSFVENSDNYYVGLFWDLMGVVGFVILIKSGINHKKQYQ